MSSVSSVTANVIFFFFFFIFIQCPAVNQRQSAALWPDVKNHKKTHKGAEGSYYIETGTQETQHESKRKL